MITIRKSDQRGTVDHGWLLAKHSFSFGSYHDPDQMGFSDLRVINQDVVQGGAGFASHPHRNMEIITYILDGALHHEDSFGHSSVIEKGDLQVMSAGRGIIHSERNASHTDPVHLLQIWILPDRQGHEPRYAEKKLGAENITGLRMIVSPDGREDTLSIHQDALVYLGHPENGNAIDYTLETGRCAYLHLARGAMTCNGVTLNSGDGARITDETKLVFTDAQDAEFLLFDLRA